MFTIFYNLLPAHKHKGQGIVEYAIIVAVVIAAGLLIWGVFGDALRQLYLDLVGRIALPSG